MYDNIGPLTGGDSDFGEGYAVVFARKADAELVIEAVNDYDRLRAIEAAASAFVRLHDEGKAANPTFAWCDGQCEPLKVLRAAIQGGSET